MRIGLSTACYFSRMMTEDAISAIVASGAPVCEVFLNSFCEYTPEFTRELVRRTEGVLDVHAVHPMCTQYEPQLFSINARQRDDAFALLESVLDVACALGAGCYVMHGPLLLMGAAKNLELGRMADVANEIAQRCALRGIRLGWENVSYCFFNEPEFPLWLAKHGLHDNLGFTLDIKQAARRAHDPMDYLEIIGERIVNVHVCDYVWEDGKLRLRMPGLGGFDFARLMQKLRSLGYDKAVLVEVYSDMYSGDGELRASLEALSRLTV